MRDLRGKTEQEKGFDFEKVFGQVLGIKPTRGSGNQWFAKMDLASSSVLFSLKHTGAESYRLTRDHLREVQKACDGEQEPVVAVSVQGEVFIVQRADDWIAARTKPADAQFIEPTRAAVRRASSRVPALLRQMDDEE